MTPPVAFVKNCFIGNAYLVRQEIRYFNAALNGWSPWVSGPASVSLCTSATDPVTGVVTYTPIATLGPFSLVQGAAGTWYVEISASLITAALNKQAYLNQVIYQVVTAGASNELQDVQPLLVSPSRFPQ